MSVDDLPETWDHLPLDDPGLAADVVDLLVSHADRLGGCVCLLLLDGGMRLRQPCVVGEIPDSVDPAGMRPFLAEVARMVASGGGGILFARGRDGSVLLTDADRAWHENLIEACRVGGVPLVGAFVATPAAVRSYPGPLVTVSDVA